MEILQIFQNQLKYFPIKNFQKLFRTGYIDAKIFYESLARIEMISKSTQTDLFRFENPFSKKYSKTRVFNFVVVAKFSNNLMGGEFISVNTHRSYVSSAES